MTPRPVLESPPANPWSTAVKLLARWIEEQARADALLNELTGTLSGVERARCQHLFFGAVRNKGRIEAHLQRLIKEPPRARLQAVLWTAGFELMESADEKQTAAIVHHAVEQTKTLASAPEARLVNAVLRKVAAALAAETFPARLAPAEQLATYFSHPEWLVRRWLAQFGADATRALLEWNQRPGPVYARWRSTTPPGEAEKAWLRPTPWAGFFEVQPGHWSQVEERLANGVLYLQDPSTRQSVELLSPRSGETILDACAAPGGKSLLIADTMLREGVAVPSRVVAFDLPGTRIERLKENLSRTPGVDVALVQGDLADGAGQLLKQHDLPLEYPGVLVDVPCSNTGVMRHRIDVKWRLQENDFSRHARQQLNLLVAASRRVAAGGRLVYSTCSIDAEENERVIAAFLSRAGGRFKLEQTALARPWECGHDGAAAFLLRRTV